MAPTRKLAELFYDLRIKTEGMQKDVDASERHLGRLTKFVLANPVTAFAAVGTAAATAALAGARMAAEIETSMRRVQAATAGGADGVRRLQTEIADLSKQTGRTQAELASAAETAAKSSANTIETGARLRAAVQASQATGTDLAVVLDGLDQALDLFNRGSDASAQTLAELFEVAKGRAPLTDLFDALGAAAPAIQQLNLDLPTAARALVALGESGLAKPKQAASALKDLATQGEAGRVQLERLAATIPRAASPMALLAQSFEDANNNSENLAARLRTQLSATLIEIGTKLLPPINAGLQQLLQLMNGGTKTAAGRQNSILELLLFGDKDGTIATTNARFREAREAVLDLSKAFADGANVVSGLDKDQLAALQRRLEFFSSVDVIQFVSPDEAGRVRALLAEVQRLQQATGAGSGKAKSLVVDPDAAKRAEELQRAFREVGDAFEDLLGRAQRGDVGVQEFDRSLRELTQKFVDLKNPTSAMRAEFKVFLAELNGLRPVLVNTKTEALALEFRKLLVEMTPDTVDDFRLSLELLARELKKSGFTGDQVDQIIHLREELEKVRKEAEAQRGVIAATVESNLTPIQKLNELTRQRQDLEAQRVALIGKSGPDVDAKRLQIAQALLEVEEGMAKVGDENASNLAAMAVRSGELASVLSDAASFAYGLASAVLGADDSIVHMIGGVSQVAAGFGRIADLAEKAKGFGNLLSTGAGIASTVPALAGILGGVSAISSAFGGKDDERDRITAENTAALEKLRTTLGDALRISASGRDISGIRSSFNASGLATNDSIAGLERFLAELDKLGIRFDQVRELAREAGVSLSQNPTLQELRALGEALNDLDFAAFGDGFAGAIRRLEAEARVDPEAFKGIEGVIKRLKVLAGDDGSDLFKEVLALAETGDIEAALAKAKEMFANIGSLTAEDLDGLNVSQFVDELLSLIESLSGLQPKAKTAAESFEAAMEAIGVQIEFAAGEPLELARARLEKVVEAFKAKFPDFSQLVDTSSAEAFSASIQSIIEGFAADGELSDAEKEQIAILRLLKDAFADATPEAERFIDSLQALLDRFEIFGISAKDQVDLLLAEFTNPDRVGKNKNFDLLKGLTDGLDISSAEGVKALRERAKQIVLQLAEGGITEEEQAVIDALKRILGTAEQAAKDAADAAAAAAEDAEREASAAAEKERERRKKILADAEDAIAFEDIEDPAEILRRRIKAVSEAFPELAHSLEGIDLATEDGRAAFDELLTQLREKFAASPELADALGLSIEDILDALGLLEGGLDSLSASIQSVAEQITEALGDLEVDLDIEGITDPIERLKRTAKTAGGIEKSIGDALAGIDLGTDEGRKKAEAALQALAVGANSDLKAIILRLLNQIRGIPDASDNQGDGAGAGDVSTAAGRENLVTAASITEVTANRWLDIATSDLALSRERNAILQSILAASSGTVIRPPAISFPSLQQNTETSARTPSLALNIDLGGVHFNAPVTTADATELSNVAQRGLLDLLQRQFAQSLLLELQRLGISRTDLA